MGRLRRRLSIGSSKSRAQSANSQREVMDVEEEVQSHDVGGRGTLLQEVGGSDGAPLSSPTAQQKRRPSFLAKLRRRSSSVAPPRLDSPGGSASAGVSDDIVAAASAAEMAREGGIGVDETSSHGGRLSRRSSFSVMAQARAVLGRSSISRASESRENHVNTNTPGSTVVLEAPPSNSFVEGALESIPNYETIRPLSSYMPPGITITRDPTEDAHDEEGAYFSHLPLEKDPIDTQIEHKEESSLLPTAASLELVQEDEGSLQKEVTAVEQNLNSKEEMAMSETSDQPTVEAPPSLVDTISNQETIEEHAQEKDTLVKGDEPCSASGLEKPRRKLKVNSHKKDGRSGGGSAKNDCRKEKAGKALKKDIEKRGDAEEKKEEAVDGPDEITKPASRWHRRLSLSRERRQSTQSRLPERKKEGDTESVLDCESVCTPDAGSQSYLGRIRRKISISRERRASRDSFGAGKKEDTGETGRTYIGSGIEGANPENEADEVEGTTDITKTEGDLLPKKPSGWSRLRRSSITSAVSVVRGRSRDARGVAGAQHEVEQRAEQEIDQDNGSITGEKHSIANSLRRRLSRSSLRLPRAHSRESSLCSKGQEGDECGNAHEGSECVAAEKRTWRRRLSDRFRSKSRDPPLPSPAGKLPMGRAVGTEDQTIFPEDVRNSEYANSTLESTNSSGERRALVEKESALQEPILASEERNYNQSGHRSGGEKQANGKGALSEELSEPFAVTPETSQTPSEQSSSADMTPRYTANEYSKGQKLSHTGERINTVRRDQSGDVLAEARHRSGTQENKVSGRAVSRDRPGAEEFMQWMNHSQEEEEEEDETYMALQDEHERRDRDSNQLEGDRLTKKANAEEQGIKLGIFFCCGNDGNDTVVEKDKWKHALQTRLATGQAVEEKCSYGEDAHKNRRTHLRHPLRCKDLFEDAEVSCAYPLCYGPTDCLLELGMAI